MAAIVAVLVLTPLGERPLIALLPVGDVAAVDFAALKLTGKPNQYLVCPPGLCAARAHGESPVFDVSLEALRSHWDAVIAEQPRVARLAEAGDQVDYVQRTAMVRFPDLITVRFIALTPAQSTLAIYSRSIYGSSDFGVNRERIEAWLAALDERLPE